MKRFFLLLSILPLISLNSFSQTESNKTIFSSVSPGQTNKISLKVNEYNSNTIGQLKDELSNFKEKILIVDYNEASFLLTIVYNEHMLKQDFITIFKKYNISYKNKDDDNNPKINHPNK